MKCDRCSKKAVAYLRYMNRKLCTDHFIKLTDDRIRKNISKNKLFKRNDHVVMGISGGKDSVTLLRFMHKFAKQMPLRLTGIVVDEGIKGYRDESVKIAIKNFEELDVPAVIYNFKDEVGKTMDQIAKKGDKIPCTYCGVIRRRIMNNAAKELKADVVATGHNLDDEVQSTVMNYFRGDFARMSRIGAKTPTQKGYVPRVKPLREVPEKEIGLYTIVQGFPFHNDECPYVQQSLRCSIRNKLNELEAAHPGTKFQILKGVNNLMPLLEGKFDNPKLNNCPECGERTPAKICKYCATLEEI
ncbi:MAG: TIGR00269 family protein [archaeon]